MENVANFPAAGSADSEPHVGDNSGVHRRRRHDPASDEFAVEFDAICSLVAGRLARNGALPAEFWRFVGLLPDIKRVRDAALLREAKIIANYLGKEGECPDDKQMIDMLAARLPSYTAIPALHVMLGVLAFLASLLLINLLLSYLWQTSAWSGGATTAAGFYLFNVSPWQVIAIASAGGLGSIVSILTRLSAFGGYAGIDRRLLWMIGGMRPVIGIAFALFLFAVLQAPILPFTFVPGPPANFEFVALAFIAGFSERFARGVIATVEGRFAGAKAE